MSDAEHLIENALHIYRRLSLNGKSENFAREIKSDPCTSSQMESTGISAECLMDMVCYVYFDVMDSETKRMDYFNEASASVCRKLCGGEQ